MTYMHFYSNKPVCLFFTTDKVSIFFFIKQSEFSKNIASAHNTGEFTYLHIQSISLIITIYIYDCHEIILSLQVTFTTLYSSRGVLFFSIKLPRFAHLYEYPPLKGITSPLK